MSATFAELEGVIRGLKDVVSEQVKVASVRSQQVGVRLSDSLSLPTFNPDEPSSDWSSFLGEWKRVIQLAGSNLSEDAQLELLRQSMKGSAGKVASVYFNGTKLSLDGLVKHLSSIYEKTTEARKGVLLKRFKELKLKSQPNVIEFNAFFAEWLLLDQQLKEVGISIDGSQQTMDFLDKLPTDIAKFISLQPKRVEMMDIKMVKDLVVRYCEQNYSRSSPSTSNPVMLSTPPTNRMACRFFAKGHCKFGSKCRFRHVGPDTTKRSRTSTTKRCYFCKETGHFIADCPHIPKLVAGVSPTSTGKDGKSDQAQSEGQSEDSRRQGKALVSVVEEKQEHQDGPLPVVTALSVVTPQLPCCILGVGESRVKACIDTGASKSLISINVLQKLISKGDISEKSVQPLAASEVYCGLGSQNVGAHQLVYLPARLNVSEPEDQPILASIIIQVIEARLPNDIEVLIGNNTLSKLQAVIDYGTNGPQMLYIRRSDLRCAVPFINNGEPSNSTVLVGSGELGYGTRRPEVRLLWKGSSRPPINRWNAESRSTRLEIGLRAVGAFDDYNAKLMDYVRKGYVVEIKDPGTIKHFMPHRAVFKPSATSTKIRPVFDARSSGLNAYLLPGKWLHPSLVRVLINWRCAKFFTFGDLEEAFLQVSINSMDVPFLGYVWCHRFYVFQRLVMGLRCSPHLLQRSLFDLVDHEYRLLLANIYMDDVGIFGQDRLERDENLLILTKLLLLGGQRFNALKWINEETKGQRVVLGVGWTGAAEESTGDCLYATYKQSNSKPETLTRRSLMSQLHGFYDPLGLALPVCMYGRYIITKASSYGWDIPLPKSFDDDVQRWHQLRHASPSIPRLLPVDGEVVIFTDASNAACAAVAYVNENLALSKGHMWTKAEAKWSTPRQELQALVLSLDLLAYWGLDRSVTICSDSEITLCRLNYSEKRLCSLPVFERRRVAKLQEAFSRYKHLRLVHVDTKYNKADLPSRPSTITLASLKEWYDGAIELSHCREFGVGGGGGGGGEDTPDDQVLIAATAVAESEIDIEDIKKAQDRDAGLQSIKNYLRSARAGHKPSGDASSNRKYERLSQLFILQDDTLCFHGKNVDSKDSNLRVVVPKAYQQRILWAYHGGPLAGHPGRSSTYAATKKKYFWFGLFPAVRSHVAACMSCRRRKAMAMKFGFMRVDFPSRPWQVVSVDLITDLPPGVVYGYRHIVVILDNFSRYLITAGLLSKQSTEVARCLWERLLCAHGSPDRVHTDRGGEFIGSAFRTLLEDYHVKVSMSTSYRPQGNATNERSHQSLLHEIAIALQERASANEHWELHLPGATFAHNIRCLSGLSVCPYEIIYGRRPRLPAEVMMPDNKLRGADDPEGTVRDLRQQLKDGIDLVRDYTLEVRLRQKLAYDRDRIGAPAVKVGDKMIVKKFTGTRLGYRWSKPLVVCDVTANGSLYFKDPDDLDRDRKTGPVNIDHVLPFDSCIFNVDVIDEADRGKDPQSAEPIVIDDNITEVERYMHSLVLDRSMYLPDLLSHVKSRFKLIRDLFKSH
ncbi:hypothetical protein FOZ62_020138, partial [Perkinsus olseni]